MKAISIEYHDVVSEASGPSGFPGGGPDSYKLSSDDFEQHLVAIYSVVPARTDTVVGLLDGASPRDGMPYLTFDDGGVSASTVIAPMLERFGVRGHFFVTTDRIGTGTFVSADQIRALVAAGHVIGSHSCSHPSLMAHCSDEQLADEWSRSVATLTGIIGAPVITASIPGGLYSRRVARAAARAGIRVLFNSEPVTRVETVDGCLVLGRFTMRRHSPPQRAASIAAGHLAPRAKEWLVRRVLTTARHIGGPVYLKLRSAIFKLTAPPTGSAPSDDGQQ